MSSATARSRSKGKARAIPTESDPLLGEQSAPSSRIRPPSSRHRVGPICLTASLALLSGFLAVALLAALLAGSFKPSESEIQSLTRTAFRYSTSPDSLSVLNITDEGIFLNVTVRCGIDADLALGIGGYHSELERHAAEAKGFRGTGAAWWEQLRTWAANQGLRILPERSVSANVTAPIRIFPNQSASVSLLTVSLPQPVVVPLISNVRRGSKDDYWLQPVTVLALVKPVTSTGDLLDFLRRGWEAGEMNFVINAEKVIAELPGTGAGWMGRYTRFRKEGIVLDVNVPVPHLPGIPLPGRPLDLASLVKLRHYELHDDPSGLAISAEALAPNMVRSRGIDTTVPFGLPFAISIPGGPGDQLMAEVITAPVSIAAKNSSIDLRMAGYIVADLQSRGASPDSVISKFLQNYLHGRDNPITVHASPNFPAFTPSSTPQPPSWILSALSSMSVDLLFPGPQPPPKVIHSVSIDHMRISEASGKVRASGVVVAEIDLPKGMDTVKVDVKEVLPDVIIYNGPVQEDDGNGDYPPMAFGHIRPDDFIPATTELSEDPMYPFRLVVKAPIENVPIDILPGRDRMLSEFVSKIVFKGGAMAGIDGKADVNVVLRGVKGLARLGDLPVRGETWVGRQKVLGWHENA